MEVDVPSERPQCPASDCLRLFPSWESVHQHLLDPTSGCYTGVRIQDPTLAGIHGRFINIDFDIDHPAFAVLTPDSNLISTNYTGPTVSFNHAGPISISNHYHDPDVPFTTPPLLPQDARPLEQSLISHPNSGWTYGRRPNTLEKMDNDKYAHRRVHNVFYPFSSKEDWDLAKFLSKDHTQSQVDAFLKLQWSKDHPQSPSYTSANMLRDRIESLPSGPKWLLNTIAITGYPTEKPIRFIWRNGLEGVEHLLASPAFAHHMSYDPVQEHQHQGNNWERQYHEFWTGTYSWKVQDKLPPGATIIGVILASDKTQVTTGTGGLEMHPIFLTLANIRMDVRSKAMSHSWIPVGFLPIIKFKTHTDFQAVLAARLWHTCLDLITTSLKHCARFGAYAPDPNGLVRHIYTPLVAYTADLPEQQLISCVAKSASPTSMARTKDFGSEQKSAVRFGFGTLETIRAICTTIDPWDLVKFLPEAKKHSLSGANLPFWRDWPLSDPSSFLVPEILHTAHKFFFDHPLSWCKVVVGAEELNRRFQSLHKRIGYRHFASGVTHVNQMTGREHRDLQRTIVGVIAGAVHPGFLAVIRALVDFIYVAQYPRHTPRTIGAMQEALKEFHDMKHWILQEGGRLGKRASTHVNIPKLELFHGFAQAITQLGAIMQYTADVSERLLITHCKHTFKGTNRRGFWDAQCVEILDRQEKIRMFDLYTLLRSNGGSLINDIVAAEDTFMASTLNDSYPEAAWISQVLPNEKSYHGPRLERNLCAAKGCITVDSTAAFLLNLTPHERLSVDDAAKKFQIPDLRPALQRYLGGVTRTNATHLDLGFDLIEIWTKFRIQLHSVHHSNVTMPAETVQALPPTPELPHGVCDTVLAKNHAMKTSAIDSCHVVQVRMVFQLVPRNQHTVLHERLRQPLVYIQYFGWAGKRSERGVLLEEDGVDMYLLKRQLQAVSFAPLGDVIVLTDVTRPIEILPVFGQECNVALMSSNSLDIYEDYYLNNFSDKEVYAMLLNELN